MHAESAVQQGVTVESNKPADVVKNVAAAGAAAVGAAADAVKKVIDPPIPGAPSPTPPAVDEPIDPHDPLPPQPFQSAPEVRTASGKPVGSDPAARSQQGEYLTTANGLRLYDTDHSLKAGPRGPVLLQDHHLREKITHFDHERIPERVVHARGVGAHGVFVANGSAASVCRAGFLQARRETEAFVRFSTVLGSRGSADTVRDTRGFATKFYTEEGTFDLVGNNMPVFFIQDAIKFPDIIHAAKPHPDTEVPQAQSAHDTFWDFVSLHTEAQHHTLWNMSDRGIPRSLRTMEGFGVHTFRLVNAQGETALVKFHWKPALGVHSLTWEEAQLASGMDPDFHRRDLYNAIEAGAYPEYDLGIQVMPDTPEETFEGIDLLDPTKLVPEELAPVQVVGRLTLNANPTNFFAETEQVAFHLGNLVPGIEPTADPLLQGRLFSYVDTQITRLGGPNFSQIPINRPHAQVNDMLRDGFHQHAVHGGVAPYRPNSLDGGNPFPAGEDEGAYVEQPVTIAAASTVRQSPVSFGDHFSQPRLFWASMTPVEKEHIVRAYTFELGKCYEEAIRVRQLQALAQIDPVLCEQVALGLGLAAPEPDPALEGGVSPDPLVVSPALSQVGREWPVDGRNVGIIVDPAGSTDGLGAVRRALQAAKVTPLVIAPTGGTLPDGTGVQRSFLAARSIEFDALLVAGAPAPGSDATPHRDSRAAAPTTPGLDPRVELLLQECFRHAKAIGGWGPGADALSAMFGDQPGIVTGAEPAEVVESLLALLAQHRAWDRFPVSPAVLADPA